MIFKTALLTCLFSVAMATELDPTSTILNSDLGRQFSFNVTDLSTPILGGLAALLIGILIAATVFYGRQGGATGGGGGFFPGEKYGQEPAGNYGHQNFYARRGDTDNDFATLMQFLEQSFKKWEVSEIECRMYMACEAAQVENHQKHGPLAKQIYDIIKAIKAQKRVDDGKMTPENKAIIESFDYGTASVAYGTNDACQELRNKCLEAKNTQ